MACYTEIDLPVPLTDPYIVSVQSIATPFVSLGSQVYANASATTSEFSVFLDGKYSSLITSLGYERCTAALLPSPVVPPFVNGEEVYPTSASPASGAPLPTTTTTTASQVSGRRISTRQIIIVSTIVPTVVLAILVFGFTVIRRYRKKKRGEAAVLSQKDTTSNTQLYLDRKAELGDEEHRTHEMNAESLNYELDGQDRICEIPSDRHSRTVLASLQAIHEMRGTEHSQELEVPGVSS